MVIVLAALAVGIGLVIYGNHQMRKIPELSFEDSLNHTLKGHDQALITVGVLQSGQATYTVYGEDGVAMPQMEHTYEIGSLTKTFTAALILKAIEEGKVNLDDGVDKHLDLPEGSAYPTVAELLTHTSGYKAHYFEMPMIGNFLRRRNDFHGVTGEILRERLAKVSVSDETKGFLYSNFGYATLGLVLEAVYGADYSALVNGFASDELGLENTRISMMEDGRRKPWAWKEGDAYLAAGGLTSTISDMLEYARLQLAGDGILGTAHASLAVIDASSKAFKTMGIHLDEIGAGWIMDRENNIIWHNGGTGDYNCYLGFSLEKETAVVVLSNLAPNHRIPGTVLGIKLLKQYFEE